MDEERLQTIEAHILGLSNMVEYILIEMAEQRQGPQVLTACTEQLKRWREVVLAREMPDSSEVQLRALDLQIEMVERAEYAIGLHPPSSERAPTY